MSDHSSARFLSLLALGGLLVASACSSVDAGANGAPGDPVGSAGAFPEAPLDRVSSESGALAIEVRTAPRQPPTRGSFSVEYRIADRAGRPADGLAIEVVPWMPVMGHGSSKKPTIEAEGEGRYVVSDVALFMAGRWELRTAITGPTEDRATVVFDLP